MYGFKQITPPAALAVELDTIKTHLRVELTNTTEDDLITMLINTAVERVEEMGTALITQTWDLVMDGWPDTDELRIPRPPLQAITGIYYTPNGGSELEFASTNYIVDTFAEPGRVVLHTGVSWPSTTLQRAAGVRVRWVCGYGDAAADVPKRFAQAIALMCGHWYENREQVVITGAVPKEIPQGAMMLIKLDGTGIKVD